MAKLQSTLIYIEKENIEEAEFMSRSFVKHDIKTRAYLNVLGAELVIKYLASEGVSTNNLHNLHSISKVLENYDIADILLPNVHIDTRVVFDKNQLFIPKIHYKNGLTPDVYAFLIIDKDFKSAEFLGYCAPSAVDKKKANKDYYFVELEDLAGAKDFADFVKNFVGKNVHEITEEEMLRGRQLSISLADHNINEFDEKELLELLLSSDVLRESVLEFDNFETLAYSAVSEVVKDIDPGETITSLPATDDIEISDDLSLNEAETAEELLDEPVLSEYDITEEGLTDKETDDISIDEPEIVEEETVQQQEEVVDDLGESMLEDGDGISLEEEMLSIDEEPLPEPTLSEEMPEITDKLDNDSDKMAKEIDNVEPRPVVTESVAREDLSVDEILDKAIASIDKPKEEPSEKHVEDKKQEKASSDDKKDGGNAVGEVVKDIAGTAGAATVLAAGAAAAGAAAVGAGAAAQGELSAAASESAMKLAGVSGEIIKDVVTDNINKQSEVLDRIDSEKVGMTPEVVEISAESEAVGKLSASKYEENLKNDQNAEFKPKDMSQLNKVETIASETKEQRFEHETVDMYDMETVENDLYREEVDSGVDIDTLTDLEAVMKKEEELTEDHILSESEVVELPDSAGYTISEDGTSSYDYLLDNATHKQEEDTENLVDISPMFDDDNFIGSLNFDENSDYDSSNAEPLSSSMADILSGGDGLGNNNESPTDTAKTEETDVVPDEPEITESELIDNSAEDISIEDSPLSDAVESVETSITENSENVAEVVENLSLDEEIQTPLEEKTLSAEDVLIDENVGVEDISEDVKVASSEATVEDSVAESSTEDIDLSEVENLLNAEIAKEMEKEESSVDMGVADTVEEETTTVVEDIAEELVDAVSVEDESNVFDESIPAEIEHEEIPSDTNTVENGTVSTEEVSIDDFAGMTDSEEGSIEDFFAEATEYTGEDTTTEASLDELITEPEEPVATVNVNVVENSTKISDKTFKTGEIPIDINNVAPVQFTGPAQLGELYNEESPLPGAALLNNPGRMSANNNKSKSPMGAILGFFGLIIILAIVGGVGFGVAKMFKAPTEETPQPITDDALPVDNTATTDTNTLDVNPNNVVSMDNNTDALASTAGSATAVRTTGTATTFTDIKKLSWEVPDYISSDPGFKQYFQSAGKSLKNALTVDLLEAKDYIYSSPLRVSVTFEKDGSFRNAQVLNSTGSTQIDSIVLQTVNQTFKALKAPNSVGNDESTTAILKIYF